MLPLVVIHETIVDAIDIVELHQSDDFNASYHIVVKLDGGLISFVPSNKKAFGARNSKFINKDGIEESINNSVDDFAYHIALETPNDGRDKLQTTHSGYTNNQYKSLAWIISNTGIDLDRVVTHDKINTLPTLIDPRNFDLARLITQLSIYPKSSSINFGFQFCA